MEGNALRIGILGGTFNPIHNSHLDMAGQAARALGLDRVLFIVAADPPHKQVASMVDAEKRYAMTCLALCGMENVEASRIELERPGKSYTVDTLEALSRLCPGDELFIIIGSDALNGFPSWRDPQRIAELAQIVCVPRQGHPGDAAAAELLRQTFGTRVRLLADTPPGISSTDIRARVCDALPIGDMLPRAVEQYIYENGLYLPDSVTALLPALRQDLTPQRYTHTLGVVIEAIRLAARYGVDRHKARLAALLHDCAKYLPTEELTRLSGLPPTVPAVLHAPAGAVLAKTRYGVTDKEVLHAICVHSSGAPEMSKLDMVIYLADVCEPNRDFPGVEAYREATAKGLREGMQYALQRTMELVRARNLPLFPATKLAYESICKEETH